MTLQMPNWEQTDAIGFEKFLYDLLGALGFQDLKWHRGTPKNSTSPDAGRDIEARWKITDPDGDDYFEKWFVQAKHYKSGVGVRAIKDAFDWADGERPSVLLIATSSYLTKDARNWIETYERENKPSFRIKYWDRTKLEKLVERAAAQTSTVDPMTRTSGMVLDRETLTIDPIAAARPGPEGKRIREMERLRHDVSQSLRS